MLIQPKSTMFNGWRKILSFLLFCTISLAFAFQSQGAGSRPESQALAGDPTTVSVMPGFTNFQDTVPGSGTDKIYTKVEVESDYPGGYKAWVTYLNQHLHYPDEAVNKEIQGDVVVQFIVDTDGHISDVRAISGPSALRAESIRVIRESGHWTPAIQDGRQVKSYKRQPIKYRLEVKK